MILKNIEDLKGLSVSDNSHKIVEVSCEYSISDKCRGTYEGVYRDILNSCKNHDNRICCLSCSRVIKASHASKGIGRNNPNAKYKKLNDSFFKNIDSNEKAYVLGWIASDGHVRKSGVSIAIKDHFELRSIRDIICEELPVKEKRGLFSLTINSKEIANDVKEHLNLKKFGKKDKDVSFPNLSSDELKWSFIRGYFDGDGSVTTAHGSLYPKCDITSNSSHIRKSIEEFVKIPCSNSDKTNRIYWSGNNALDFLEKIYRNSISETRLHRKYTKYLEWCNWVPSLSGYGKYESGLHAKWSKSVPEAMAPYKERASDSGYDLNLISIWKKVGNVVFYETGIKVLPDFGWYFMLVPRSSLSKTGYILANSVGIIDRTYVGTIKVPLIKIDPTAADIELPFRAVQIIPSLAVHAQMIEVNETELEQTARAEGGFGSSGK